jgi:hypothetical protein
MLRSAKAALELKVPGIYSILLECVKVYVGHSGRTIEARREAHDRCIRLHHIQKSAVAEYSVGTGHCTDFSSTSVFEQQDTWIAL